MYSILSVVIYSFFDYNGVKQKKGWDWIMNKGIKYLKILCNLLFFMLVVLFLAFILPKILVFFMPFVIGFILSLIANPLVRFLEKKIKIKRKYGTVLMIVMVIGTLVLACYGVFLLLINGMRGFMDYMPTMIKNAEGELTIAMGQLQDILHKVPALSHLKVGELGGMLQDTLNDLLNNYKEPTVSAIGGFAKSIPDILVSAVMGLLATYFFIADRDKIMSTLKRHVPKTMQDKCMIIYNHILRAVGGYFKAQFKIMGVIYIIITIGLMFLGQSYAWLIGFGIAFLDMLPVFGTGTVLIPWAVVKIFSGNIATAIGMVILYAVSLLVHQLIQPKMVGESIGLDPFATLFFMYIGYEIKGVIGMIIAIPIGMVLCTLYEAGAFEHLTWCIKEIASDFAEFCKINPNQDNTQKK